MRLVFQESNFYNSIAVLYYDLVIFGTATMLIYEDFENVINCVNPCAGEYYVDLNGQYQPVILAREFTMTIGAVVNEFGIDNVSASVRTAFELPDGSGKTREIIVAHLLEPNNDGRKLGIPEQYAFREVFWEWGGSTSPQSGPQQPPGFLRKKGYFEQPQVTVRWDLVSNDPYGRSPAMDGLGDQKQLQLESRRKAQAIDKMVNPPLVADIQLKNQPASLLPGGMTYIQGMQSGAKPAIQSIYETKFPVKEITEDLAEVRDRLKKVFFNDLFQTASQFETRSNITAVEWDMRKSESMVMLGPVLERIDHEGLKVVIERVWAMMVRAKVIPPPPQEVADMHMDIEFQSMLAQAQDAAQAGSIERVLGLVGNLAGVDPGVMDNINVDFAVDNYSSKLNNDPRMIRSPDEVAMIREERAKQQQAAQQADIAEKLSAGAKNLAAADTSGENALTTIMGG